MTKNTNSKSLPTLLIIFVVTTIFASFYVFNNNYSVVSRIGTNETVPDKTLVTINNKPYQPTEEDKVVRAQIDQIKGTVVNQQGGYKLTVPEVMYVAGSPEIIQNNSSIKYRAMWFGFSDNLNYSSIQIDYGVPTLEKSEEIGCLHDPSSAPLILNGVKVVSYCLTKGDYEYYAIADLTNPLRKIEYRIYIRGTQAEKDKYLEILKNGLTWL